MAVKVRGKRLTDVTTLENVPVDSVLSTIDVDDDSRLPSPGELYDKWERQHWTVQELDFALDREQWLAMTPPGQERRMRTFVGFLHGEVAVTDTLLPYAIAVPRQEQRLFLTTQIVDEARHAVFFRRYMTEVCDLKNDDLEDLLRQTKARLGPTFNQIFDVELVEISQKILRSPGQLAPLCEGVVLYHLLIENMLALSAQRATLNQLRAENLLPGFRAGFIAVTRDESRHVLFGMRFLRDAMDEDRRNVEVINRYLDPTLPLFIESCTPTPDFIELLRGQNIDPYERLEYAKLVLRKKLKMLNLPVPTIALAEAA